MNLLSSIPCILCTVYPSVAQIEHGTVGVIHQTEEKIVVAADSRGLGNDDTPDDTVCKVAALNGDVVFVSSGSMGHVPAKNGLDPVPGWLNIEEAHRAYRVIVALQHTSKEHILDIANEWGRSVTSHLQTAYLFDRKGINDLAAGYDGGLTVALFGGLDANGKLRVFRTNVTFNASAVVPITFNTVPASCNPYCAIGQTEIVSEFMQSTSPRAKQEAKTWKPTFPYNAADYDILKTIRMVELTIRYHQGNDVGGKVDAVELSTSGHLRWFARKPNCPEN